MEGDRADGRSRRRSRLSEFSLEVKTAAEASTSRPYSIHHIIFLAILGASLAAQGAPGEPIPIVRFESDGPNVDGTYKWLYETGNEINAEESGYIKNFGRGEGEEVQVAEGKFSYKAPDGTLIALTYVADENGFQPQVLHRPSSVARACVVRRSKARTRQRTRRRDGRLFEVVQRGVNKITWLHLRFNSSPTDRGLDMYKRATSPRDLLRPG
ncbi:Endocuticle structural glycoprotein SgAbd-8 [Eumeta japonica]|uniref:Endocuticle structural glycoprotein SgAbd-8 n=1 Tax=Eumeta variegata TaxID=151549 RepID=A0A4C1YF18_EUMVA|nr:Endocuticle structural glycoprotein SgAbd-8 [Eumeta japonica]